MLGADLLGPRSHRHCEGQPPNPGSPLPWTAPLPHLAVGFNWEPDAQWRLQTWGEDNGAPANVADDAVDFDEVEL
jgi:hypothetical protein